ncbi:nickel-responsive transcriptional regulator NikR [Stappia sp. TSB10GB4]|uniref:nickel-responsive transcriptional regulator NikR n=1 Tax=Stappia sp. TSB10GB4 TaxID=2003584 RepID=UPI0016441C7B|nr:nickel-responsive transcriptional regulator NikR [Stappia sp. TSB10GB4]
MERITITVDEDLLRQIDALSEKRGYASRSEIFRDMAREALAREAIGSEDELENERPCYGALTYVYDHGIRDLPNRLTDNHHAHHALSVATTHVHVSAENCLEVSILAGTAGDLRRFADSVISQRGVRHGSLHVFPALEGESLLLRGQPHSHQHTHRHGQDNDPDHDH